MRHIHVGTDTEERVLNVHLAAYHMALAESYAQYVHNFCNCLFMKVEESCVMPAEARVLRLQDQDSKRAWTQFLAPMSERFTSVRV